MLELALEGIDIDTKDVTNVATLSWNPTSTRETMPVSTEEKMSVPTQEATYVSPSRPKETSGGKLLKPCNSVLPPNYVQIT